MPKLSNYNPVYASPAGGSGALKSDDCGTLTYKSISVSIERIEQST